MFIASAVNLLVRQTFHALLYTHDVYHTDDAALKKFRTKEKSYTWW